ncbi:MAG: rhodanese-like domain-containing protein [Phycisphaerae bacterium]|nr:rhodanese-like domain-containing protein [Phycisphaerae bacterium]
MTPRETKRELSRPEGERPLLLDCREADEWAVCRIEGAVLVPMGQVEQRLDELEDEALGRGRRIIVYCHHGRRSLRVVAALRAHGFAGAVSMAGGVDAWSLGVDPSVPRY